MAVACAHSIKVRARDITAVIKSGHLIGHESLMPKEHKPTPMEYELVDFCQSPICQKVFKAVKKEEEA